jgi:hypothetical protein
MFGLNHLQLLFLVRYSLGNIIESSLLTRLGLQHFKNVFGESPSLDQWGDYSPGEDDREIINKLKLNQRVKKTIALYDSVIAICQDFRLSPNQTDEIVKDIFMESK